VNKFLILILLHEVKMHKSSSYISLLKCKQFLNNSKLIVWDNSKIAQKINHEISFMDDFEYIHTAENRSISKIYNSVIADNKNYEYVIFLDQDSSFDSNYIVKINDAISNNPFINLFLPIVKHNDIIVSPGHYKYFKGKYWNTEKYGIINSRNILAVNSGMVISFNYLKNIFKGYDERLKFYGTDTFFMLKYAEKNEFIYVVNYRFAHNSAMLNNNVSHESRISRLIEMFCSWKIIHEHKILHIFLINIYMIFKSIKLAFKYRKIKYFKILIYCVKNHLNE